MPTNSFDFFLSTVKPTVHEFLSDKSDIRRGRLAAIVLYHMTDYWALETHGERGTKIQSENLEILCQQLIRECPAFSLIKGIADASKHAHLSKKQQSVPRQLSFSQRIKNPSDFFPAPFDEEGISETHIVMATLDDGTVQPLAVSLQSVLCMWEEKLKERNLSHS